MGTCQSMSSTGYPNPGAGRGSQPKQLFGVGSPQRASSGNSLLQPPPPATGAKPTNTLQTSPNLRGLDTKRKVPLLAGHSLMDWIRLTRQEKDLSGTGGSRLTVTGQELQKHDNENDCWIVLKGKVYNVTAYMKYHPGGEDELLRRAGADATDLFNETHHWVNYESMLAKCLVGTFKSSPDKTKPTATFLMPPPPPKLTAAPQPDKPTVKWHQSVEGQITVDIFTSCKEVRCENVIIDKNVRNLVINILVKERMLVLHWQLQDEVENEFDVDVSEEKVSGLPGKVSITLRKHNCGTMWNNIGVEEDDHMQFAKTKSLAIPFRQCVLLAKTEVTHDMVLFEIMTPDGSRVCVPVGHHVYVKCSVDGVEMTRPYTAVLPSLVTPKNSVREDLSNGKRIFLMVKIYPDGALTPTLNSLEINSEISVSNPEGEFDESRLKLERVRSLCMFAAGTGFTPMIRVIDFVMTRRTDCRLQLCLFNKTEGDIPWKEDLETLQKSYGNFEVVHILSERKEKRRIDEKLVSSVLGDAEDTLVLVCGPQPFTDKTLEILQSLNVKKDKVFLFQP